MERVTLSTERLNVPRLLLKLSFLFFYELILLYRLFDELLTLCSSSLKQIHDFRGIAFVGGFSYADVLGSAKG